MSFAKLGSQHTVNTTVAGDQYGSAVTQLLNGDIVVAWTDANGTAINVRGRILNSDGVTKDGSELMLNTTLTGSQSDVALTALGNGGFAAAWTSYAAMPANADLPWELESDAFQTHAVGQVFTSSGTKSGGETTHFLSSNDYPVDFYIDPPGLVSAGPAYLDSHEQFHPALTADLSSGGTEFTLAVVEELHLEDTYFLSPIPPIPSFVEMGMNNIAVFDSSPSFLVDQEENVTWDLAFSDILAPNLQVTHSFANPVMITLGNGDIVTAYERHHWEGNPTAAWLEKNIKVDFGNGANPATVGSDSSENPALAELDNGNIVVVWEDGDVGGGVENVVGQLFTPGGTKIGGEFAIDSSGSDALDPAVAALADGRFIVVWEDLAGDGDGSAIKGQVFTAAGDKSGEAFTVNTSTADDQKLPTVTALANGDALVTWTDYDGATSDIYSQVLDLQSYVGDSSAETVYGGSFADHLDGGGGADALYGRGGDDVFENVTLDDLDDDVFYGGAGTDTLDLDDYVLQFFGPPVLLGDNGMTSVEVINLHGPTAGVGINNVELAIPLANSSSDGTVTVNGALAQDFIFGDRINNADIALYLNGGGGDDFLYGGAGGDTLDGGDDEDWLEGNDGDDWLEGGSEDDTLLGGAGIDYLFGEQGEDYMEGGSGGDTYFVDSAGDVVVETFDPIIGPFNFDYVSSTIDYTLGAYVERLGLEGSADIDGTGNDLANYLFGNSGDNVLSGLGGSDDIFGFDGHDRLYGGSEDDVLDGGDGDDNLFGEEGNDTLYGGSEDDTLDGGIGADIMEGGTGDDIYVVDDPGDVVIELNNEGTADIIMSSIGLVLPAYLENLWLTGTANISGIGNLQDNVLVGNEGNNALTGVIGADSLYGFGGNDILWGGAGGDTIDGGEGIDTAIYTLSDVGVYADIAANLYFGGHANGDTVTGIENLIGSKYDDVLVGYTGTNVLTGAAGDDALFGVYDDDVLLGGRDDDTLTGGEGADVLNGGEGVDTASYHTAAVGLTVSLTTGTGTGDAQGDTFINIESLTGSGFTDTLTGDANANVLDGGGGSDTLQGLLGDDTYVVDDAADVVLEIANEGNDTVNASASYVLVGQSVETLQTTDTVATTAINLTGNGFANTVRGNAGNNTLNGRGGIDVLEGLGGEDNFLFSNTLDAATNVDQIVDFDVTDDQIHLNDSTFSGLPLGTLSASAFVIGAAAADANDRIIYNDATGALSFDADGTGATAAIQFATLSAGLALTNNDFLVV